MKAKMIVVMALIFSVLLSSALFAQDEAKDTKERNFGAGVYYVTFPGEDINGWGVSLHYLKDNLLCDLGYTPETKEISSDESAGYMYIDLSYLWRQKNEDGKYSGLFGGPGLEIESFGWGGHYGLVAQIGIENENGLLARIKYAMLTDSVNAFYFIVGYSF